MNQLTIAERNARLESSLLNSVKPDFSKMIKPIHNAPDTVTFCFNLFEVECKAEPTSRAYHVEFRRYLHTHSEELAWSQNRCMLPIEIINMAQELYDVYIAPKRK